VHFWADLQSVHGFCCYDDLHVCKLIAVYTASAYSAEHETSASACTRSVAALWPQWWWRLWCVDWPRLRCKLDNPSYARPGNNRRAAGAACGDDRRHRVCAKTVAEAEHLLHQSSQHQPVWRNQHLLLWQDRNTHRRRVGHVGRRTGARALVWFFLTCHLVAWCSGYRRSSHERSYPTSGPVSTGMGYTITVLKQPTRSTQPCIPPGSLNRVPALAGVKAGMSPLPGGT